MTQEEYSTQMAEAMQMIINGGLENMPEFLSTILNEAMKIERSKTLRAAPYERTDQRLGQANGFKNRSQKTEFGQLALQIPQVRGDISFRPQVLEIGMKSERALKLSMAEMYIQGVSSRRVSKIIEKLCGFEVSSSDVSRAAKLLDEELEKWRNRPIGEIKYLMLDARYEKVRMDGSVVSSAVLIATGIDPDGRRSILGVSVSVSEAEVHWRDFLRGLKKRGLRVSDMVTSDDHEGLKAALKTTLPGVPWQRCQVHLQRNAQAYVPKIQMRKEVAQDIRDIFNAPSKEEAERLLGLTVTKYETKASKLSAWMSENLPEGFAAFQVPRIARKKVRSTNLAEYINKQVKRRTRVVGLFPNEDAALRLVSALLMEISEEWESGNRYINFSEDS